MLHVKHLRIITVTMLYTEARGAILGVTGFRHARTENVSKLSPIIGNWYQGAEGLIFEVVAFDREDGTIEVQHLDGQVEEFDVEIWRGMALGEVAPPEDWRSGFELSREDAADPEQPMQTAEWTESVDQIEDVPDDDWEE